MGILLKDVSIALGAQKIFDNLNFELPDNRQVCIKGPSGAGKTSLLRAITGLLPVIAGCIKVDDLTVEPKHLTAIRSQIAYLSQQPFAGGDTGREALLFPFAFASNLRQVPEEDISRALTRCGLDLRVLGLKAKELSGGEMQKLSLARAVLLDRPIWLVDEITSALDQASRELIIQLLKTSGKTILAVSHDEAFLAAQDEVWELKTHNLHRVK